MPVLTFGSWVLNEIWIIDLSSALVGMLMSSSKLFLFSNKAHLNSGVRLLLELYRVIVIKHVAFFTICAKLLVTITSNNGIHIHTFSDVIVVSDLKKILADRRIWRKKGTDWRICIPLFTPLLQYKRFSTTDYGKLVH